jgi:uncharacterized protein (TIGR00369 family)
METIDLLNRVLGGMFPKVLNMRITDATTDRIIAEMDVTPEVCTTGSVLHGGAIMTFADFLGASATFINLPKNANTTTLESKTNFIGAARVGETVVGTCEPVHKGGRTQVWRTTIKKADGKPVAIVTQTQMVLEAPKSEQEVLTALFAGKTLDEQKALLAQLERAGAGLYRVFASQEPDEARKAELLKAAEKEVENAETLEKQA